MALRARCTQVHTLLKGLEKIAASADIPMLVAGDFNSTPGSAAHGLLIRRAVDPAHPVRAVLGMLGCPSRPLCAAILPVTCTCWEPLPVSAAWMPLMSSSCCHLVTCTCWEPLPVSAACIRLCCWMPSILLLLNHPVTCMAGARLIAFQSACAQHASGWPCCQEGRMAGVEGSFLGAPCKGE